MMLLSALQKQFVHRVSEHTHCRESPTPELKRPEVALFGCDSEGHVHRCICCNQPSSLDRHHVALSCSRLLGIALPHYWCRCSCFTSMAGRDISECIA